MIALVILVFFDSADGATPLPGALSRAVEQALGAGTTVIIRSISGEPPERDLVTAGRAVGAAAVARLSWGEPERLRATLQIRVLASHRGATDTLTFETSDPLVERGRALGLVLAALLAPENSRARDERGPAPPETRARGDTVPSGAVAMSTETPAAPRQGPWFLDASADGGIAIGGAGSAVGGTVGVGRRVAGRLGCRIGARARFGELAEAQANLLSAGLSVGLVATVVEPGDRGRFELGFRLDGLVLYETLSHFSDDDVARVRKGRMVLGTALSAEFGFLVAPGAAIIAGAGPEVVFGRTEVVVRGVNVADIAPLRVSMHGGLRITF